MNESDKPTRDLYKVWMRVMNKLNESENIPRKFGVDIPLYPSEIHTIQMIGNHPESNVRDIAEYLGITPGAASQMISKLARRGLVEKVRGKKNEKEVHLELTSSGHLAYNSHETIHENIYQRISGRIGPLSQEEITLLTRVLNSVESVYDERIEELRIAQKGSHNNQEEIN